jgi:hypothetical protein
VALGVHDNDAIKGGVDDRRMNRLAGLVCLEPFRLRPLALLGVDEIARYRNETAHGGAVRHKGLEVLFYVAARPPLQLDPPLGANRRSFFEAGQRGAIEFRCFGAQNLADGTADHSLFRKTERVQELAIDESIAQLEIDEGGLSRNSVEQRSQHRAVARALAGSRRLSRLVVFLKRHTVPNQLVGASAGFGASCNHNCTGSAIFFSSWRLATKSAHSFPRIIACAMSEIITDPAGAAS